MFLQRLGHFFRLVVVFALAYCTSYAQIKVSGHVLTTDLKPLFDVGVHVNGTVYGTFTTMDGSFNLNIPKDSAYLSFSKEGYATMVRKVKKDDVLEVRMVKLKYGTEWPLKKPSSEPIMVRKDEMWTTYTYSIDTFLLENTAPNARLAAWRLHGYTVYFPLDSLVMYLEESGVDIHKELDFLRAQKKKDTVFLPSDFLEGYRLLNDLAIRMVLEKAIVITDQKIHRIPSIEVRQVSAVFHKKNPRGWQSFWGGLEFWVKDCKQPLFVEVQIMT